MAMRFMMCVVVAAVILNKAHGISEEERKNIQGAVIKFIAECSKEFDISEDQLKTARETKSLEGIDSCALACFFKKIKFMTDDGTFDKEHAKEVGPQYLGSEDDLKKFNDATEDCASVNDEAVSDGKGCERARLLVKCIAKHKASLNV